MRKMMQKEITKTTVKVAKMEVVDGQPQAVTLPDEILLGNVSEERAQKELKQKYGFPVTVFGVQPETEIYQLSVEDFLKYAHLKPADEETADQEQQA